MIPDEMVDQAAFWVADQQREPGEHLASTPLATRRPYYFRRAQTILRRLAESGADKIGMCVPCDSSCEDMPSPMATVHVYPYAVFGYRPEDGDKASFIWPTEVAARVRKLYSEGPV